MGFTGQVGLASLGLLSLGTPVAPTTTSPGGWWADQRTHPAPRHYGRRRQPLQAIRGTCCLTISPPLIVTHGRVLRLGGHVTVTVAPPAIESAGRIYVTYGRTVLSLTAPRLTVTGGQDFGGQVAISLIGPGIASRAINLDPELRAVYEHRLDVLERTRDDLEALLLTA